jgi:hypothetical protein
VIPADLALALLVNRTADVYTSHAPPYILYHETTLVSAPSMGRSQEIDRDVAARNADGLAVMRDVPNGGQRVGDAFPIIPFFDPFSNFSFQWFANLKRIDITLQRGGPMIYSTPPPNAGVDVVVPYVSYWNVTYAQDSRPDRVHLLISPTPRITGASIYPSEIVEDPKTQLPARIVLRETDSDQVITLDYSMVDGYWMIAHGTFTATEHALMFTFVITADVTYSNFSFPTSPPPEIAQLPPPSPSPQP